MSKRKGRGTCPASHTTVFTVRCYSVPEVSALIGVSQRVLLTWARQGSIPYPVGYGTAAMWTADDVETIRSGLALPGTYLVSRSPMLRERIEALRAAARAARQNSSTSFPKSLPRRVNRMAKGGVS